MAITVTFDPPLPSDSPSVFNTKAFTLLGDLNDWSTEANSLASTVSSNASTSTTNASNASTSADAAATSASNAAASYDSFDDRYLGSKSSAPTLDNDGAALLTGALYWDSVLSAMFVRTSGGAWTALNASTGIAQAITVNSSSAALTVTQTGSGNAFVVEDSASTDSTPFVIASDGRTIIGHTSPITGVFNQAFLEVHNVAGNTAQSIQRYSADAFGPDIDFVKSRNATTGSQTVVASGDILGSLRFAGSDGTAFKPAAYIDAAVDGTPGTNDMPGRLVFSTTADGDSSPTERMRIDSAGVVSMPSCGLTIATGRKITADVDTGNITLWGGNSTGANLELYGGSHATYASLAVLDASETRFRSQNGGTEFMRIDSAGNVLVKSAAGLGYGTGAGGTVTQATSKSTAVTLNKPTGQITTASDALAAGTTVWFILNNSLIADGDVLCFSIQISGGENYNVWAANVYSGGAAIGLRNISAGSLSQAIVLNFAILKGATA